MPIDSSSAKVCPHHGSLKTEMDSQKIKISDLETRVRGIELNYIDDDEHQRTLSKMDKIYDTVISIKDSNAAMQLTFTNALNTVQLSGVKIDGKVGTVIAGIGFISSIIGALVVIFLSQFIKGA